MKSRTVAAVLVCLATLPLAACSSALVKPQLAHPGPAKFQRDNALQFDPYPPNDMGPEIDGGRPRGFLTPPNEITRARQYSLLAPRRNPAPVLPPVVPTIPAPLY